MVSFDTFQRFPFVAFDAFDIDLSPSLLFFKAKSQNTIQSSKRSIMSNFKYSTLMSIESFMTINSSRGIII